MKDWSITTDDANASKIRVTVAELKLKMAEHIITLDSCRESTDVRDILSETKVGAWRRPALLKKLKMVFAA
jgi:hypothetical protein